jgi:hypothetical protein
MKTANRTSRPEPSSPLAALLIPALFVAGALLARLPGAVLLAALVLLALRLGAILLATGGAPEAPPVPTPGARRSLLHAARA